jgi:phosphocarrier protein HPr
MPGDSSESTRLTITHPTGLHARPAVKLTKLAKGFDADIRLRGLPDGDWVDAKSIVKVMGLKLKTGTEIEIEAVGSAAAAAVAELADLVARNFDEEG